MIKTVFFDLGNVLIFFSHARMWQQLGACTGIETDAIKTLFLEDQLLKRYEEGAYSTQEICEIVRKQAKRSFTWEDLKQAACDIFTPNYEIWPIVHAIKEKGIRLVLLSNTSECHYEYIKENYSIVQLFDHPILSYEVGACKPDLQIFKEALRVAECAPSECFYTDDIPAFIESAATVGLPGAVFRDVPSLREHLAKRDLIL